MQDRFKCRVWDKETNKYINFEQWKKSDIEFNFNPPTNEIWCEFNHCRYIVEQCTGLKDKNGRLIYEGDIVKRLFFNDRRKNKMKNCIVKWCDGRAVFTLYADMRDDYRSYEANCDNVFKECEVIGNIHENPELMEE